MSLFYFYRNTKTRRQNFGFPDGATTATTVRGRIQFYKFGFTDFTTGQITTSYLCWSNTVLPTWIPDIK